MKHFNATHGMKGTRVYTIWHLMKQRCLNLKSTSYPRYGARGVKPCVEWLEFINFFNDMGHPPSDDYSIERIDNTKGYCKENCKWATKKEQQNNTRYNVNCTIDGITKTLTQWSEDYKIEYGLLYDRYMRRKWGLLDALTTPKRIKSNWYKRYEHKETSPSTQR